MTAYERKKARVFAEMIIDLHSEVEFSVTSWFRTPARNRHVGGAARSKHLTGLGIDVVLDDPDTKGSFMARVKAIGLFALDEGDHIHIQVPKGQ